ncbi:MAG: hypothetical protein ACRCZ9_10350 [Fusobacteriaceae bacterium]
MEFWKFMPEDQEDIMEFEFNLNLRTRDRKVVLTTGISQGLDLRILFSVVSELKEREILMGADIEKFQEFYLQETGMRNNHSDQVITLPCQIEPVIIYVSIEEYEGEYCWIVMYEDEYEEVVKWNISA